MLVEVALQRQELPLQDEHAGPHGLDVAARDQGREGVRRRRARGTVLVEGPVGHLAGDELEAPHESRERVGVDGSANVTARASPWTASASTA